MAEDIKREDIRLKIEPLFKLLLFGKLFPDFLLLSMKLFICFLNIFLIREKISIVTIR
jgi:hypothetical protein